MAPDGKMFMEVSGTTEAVCALMIVVGASGSVTIATSMNYLYSNSDG